MKQLDKETIKYLKNCLLQLKVEYKIKKCETQNPMLKDIYNSRIEEVENTIKKLEN